MTIYLDDQFRCHVTQLPGGQAVEIDYFDGKCAAYIEGYRYVPEGQTYVDDRGTAYEGVMVAPFKDYTMLEAIQQAYAELAAVQDAMLGGQA